MPENDQERVVRNYERKSSNDVINENKSVNMNQQNTDSFSGVMDNDDFLESDVQDLSSTISVKEDVNVDSSLELEPDRTIEITRVGGNSQNRNAIDTSSDISSDSQEKSKNAANNSDNNPTSFSRDSYADASSSDNLQNSDRQDSRMGNTPASTSNGVSNSKNNPENGKPDNESNQDDSAQDNNQNNGNSSGNESNIDATPNVNTQNSNSGDKQDDSNEYSSQGGSKPSTDTRKEDSEQEKNDNKDSSNNEKNDKESGENKEKESNDSENNNKDGNENQPSNNQHGRDIKNQNEESVPNGFKYRKGNNVNHSNNFAGNPRSNNNSENNSEKKDDSKDKAEDAAKKASEAKDKAKKTIDTVGEVAKKTSSWKLYLAIGAVICALLLLLIIYIMFIDSSFIDNLNGDNSTGVVLRTSPASSYMCAASSSTKSNNASSSSGNDMNLAAPTPYTKAEFIEKVQSFTGYSSDICTKEQTKAAYEKLSSRAGYIYDVGVKLGINPEIIFLRAQAEGYAPSCKPAYESYNNFYGMSCYNGANLSSCSKFATVEDGIYNDSNPKSTALFNWIIRNMSDIHTDYSYVFGIYAQLWTEWSKDDGPTFTSNDVYCNDWGLGACCYSRVVEKHLKNLGREDRADLIKNSCEGNAGVIPVLKDCQTRATWYEESNLDQRAYALYQTENILKIRKSIFDLDGDTLLSGQSSYVCEQRIITIDLADVVNNRTDNSLKDKTISAKLQENGTTIDALNEGLVDLIVDSGVGTRKAVVNAGKYLINSFAAYNTKLVYMYTGGHSSRTDASGKTIAFENGSYYGINPYFGAKLGSPITRETDNGTKYYNYVGLDCSGFVNWALKNGGLNIPNLDTAGYIANYADYNITLRDFDEAQSYIQVGDVLVVNDVAQGGNNHHAALIVEYDKNSITYLEEVGVGLVATKKDLTDSEQAKSLSKYKVADLSYWYENAPKYDDYKKVFNAGLIKEG